MLTMFMYLSSCFAYTPLFSAQMTLSLEMSLFMVTLWGVFASVYMWSFYYAGSYKDFISYSFLSLLFVYSMALLMVAKNTMTLLMGWDGLGCTSFLLICHFMNWTSKLSAMVVVLSNKVGDALLIWVLGFSTIYSNFDASMYHQITAVLLLLCCLTKAAQFPFMSWLPLSMNAPTTTSALVHSSTLVCAGVILLSKTQMLGNITGSFWVIFTSIVVAGSCALVIFDMKKLVAFSTLSQMSFLILLMIMNSHAMAILHMVAHAFIKSSLFMGVGNLIHTSSHQNWVFMKHNYSKVNTTLVFLNCMMLSGLALVGSSMTKDFSYDTMMASNMSMMAFASASLFIGMTTTYSMKMCFMASKSMKWTSSITNSEVWQTMPILLPTMAGMVTCTMIGLSITNSLTMYKTFTLQSCFILMVFLTSVFISGLLIIKPLNTILLLDTMTLKLMSTTAFHKMTDMNEISTSSFKQTLASINYYFSNLSTFTKVSGLSMLWVVLILWMVFFPILMSMLNFGLSGTGSCSMY